MAVAPSRQRYQRISVRKGQSPPSPGCPPAPRARSQTSPLHPPTSPFSKLLAAINRVLPLLPPEPETLRKGICRPDPSLHGGHEGRLRGAASLAEATVNAEAELGQDRAREALLPPLRPLPSGAAPPCQGQRSGPTASRPSSARGRGVDPTLRGSFVSRLLVASHPTLRGYGSVQTGEGALGVTETGSFHWFAPHCTLCF